MAQPKSKVAVCICVFLLDFSAIAAGAFTDRKKGSNLFHVSMFLDSTPNSVGKSYKDVKINASHNTDDRHTHHNLKVGCTHSTSQILFLTKYDL